MKRTILRCLHEMMLVACAFECISWCHRLVLCLCAAALTDLYSCSRQVHQNKSNVLVCRICEKDHDSQLVLQNHMKNCHNTCEMPYICHLCNFRSSIYSDVVDHFKKVCISSESLCTQMCHEVISFSCS